MMAEKIRILMIKTNTSVKDIAAKLGCTPQNISSKLTRDNFSEKELREIAEVMGSRFVGTFVRNDTGEEV